MSVVEVGYSEAAGKCYTDVVSVLSWFRRGYIDVEKKSLTEQNI